MINISDNIQEVMYDYDANETDELSIKQMEMLVIIERDNTDWWKARKGKRIGYVPTTYIKQPKAGHSFKFVVFLHVKSF